MSPVKKWLLPLLAVVLLCGYGIFLSIWHARTEPMAADTASTAATVAAAEHTQLPTSQATTVQTTQAVTVTEATFPPFPAELEAQLTASHAFVYDCTDGTRLYSLGDQTQQIAPASLTKLFTIHVAMQYLEPEALVQAGPETQWIHPVSSRAAVTQGDILTAEQLVQGMLMQSGNDAAYVLAVAAGRAIANDPAMGAWAALEAFIAEMNTQLQALGLSGTHFVTPDGLDADGHHTTAEDMLAIALLVADDPLIRRYSALHEAHVFYENGEDYIYRSTNFLLQPESPYYCPTAVGLKTGSTSKAGNCLLALFQDGDRLLLIGVFGCPTYEARFDDALLLYGHYQ